MSPARPRSFAPAPATGHGRSPGRRIAALALILVLAVLGGPAMTPSIADAQDGDQHADTVQADSASDTEAPSDEPVAERPVRAGRLSGDSRLETAVAIAQRAFPNGAETVYLANGASMVDAVAAGSLTDGPVLLVTTCELPAVVAEEITRLHPGDVVALGGPAAVCDEVLDAAVIAARGDTPMPVDLYDFSVTADVEVIDATSTPPFTVDATDPGIVFEGGTFTHQIAFTGTDGTVALDDPRFSGVLTNGDDMGEAGQLVVSGRGCGPTLDGGQPIIVCQEDFLIVVVEEGEATTTEVTLHTDDARVGDTPMRAGTYVLDQMVRWDVENVDGEVQFDDGQATVRVTYTVTAPDGGTDTPQPANDDVVEWQTTDGTYFTTGHSDADLERIREGVEEGTHIGVPNGRIHRGHGDVNVGHDWHVTEVELADITVDTCDGSAAQVDAELDRYLDVGWYCPWSAVPIAIHN